MRNLSELNINEGGRPVVRSAPSPALIAKLEKLIGFSLPLEYKQLLQLANGGHPELDTVQRDASGNEYLWAVDTFYHLDEEGPASAAPQETDTYNIFWVLRQWSPVIGPGRLPFAGNGGGDLYFLDFKTSKPTVQIYIHDGNDAPFRMIAPSFDWFIDSLGPNPDYI